jgi:valyl-tRNA synthetase
MNKQSEAEFFKSMAHHFLALANARLVNCGPDVVAPPVCDSMRLPGGLEVFVDLTDIVDLDGELTSKRKEYEKLKTLSASKKKKLENKNFIERAPKDIVQKVRAQFRESQERELFTLIQLNKLLKMKLERLE